MKAASEVQESLSGRYEVSAQQFEEILKDEPKEDVQLFDLKLVLPPNIVAAARMVDIAEKLWRRILDEALRENGGAYSLIKNSSFVQVWFENVPTSAARAKIPAITDRIASLFKRIKESSQGPEAAFEALFPKKQVETRAAPQMSPDLAQLMAEGLPANPRAGLFELWAIRTTQSIIHNSQPTPFARELMEVVSKADITYLPVWTAPNELLVGSYAQVRVGIPVAQYSPVEALRQDLIALCAICFQLTVLAQKNLQSLGFVSLRLPILTNRTVLDLMTAFLHRVAPNVRKNLIFEIKGLPNGGLSPAAKTALDHLAQFCKAFTFETAPLSKDDYRSDYAKLYGCGLDLTGSASSEVEMASIIRKYAEMQKPRNLKTFVKGLPTAHLIKVAKDCGFMYLSGPAVHPAEKYCTAIRQFPIRL